MNYVCMNLDKSNIKNDVRKVWSSVCRNNVLGCVCELFETWNLSKSFSINFCLTFRKEGKKICKIDYSCKIKIYRIF